jgi:adenine-specific DNA glycosylase
LLAFGYNQSTLALDTNLMKIFSRYYLGTKHKEVQKNKTGILDDFNTLILQLQKQAQKEKISGRDINNALMDFGALISNNYD